MLKNLKSCLVWSIILQNSRIFSLYDLYRSIVRLSYLGDLRVIFAENPNKVENMIKGYYLMTENVLKEKEKNKIGDDSLLGIWYEDAIHQLGNEISVKQFPSASQLEPIESAKQHVLKVSDSFQTYVAKSEDIISPSFLGISRWSIIYISTWPSSIQSLKGILSAGPCKATKYLLRKIFKRFS